MYGSAEVRENPLLARNAVAHTGTHLEGDNHVLDSAEKQAHAYLG